MSAARLRAVVLAVALFCWVGTAGYGQTVLRWHFQEGASYKGRTVFRVKNEIKGPKGTFVTEIHQDLQMTVRVRSVASDGSAVLEETVDRIVLRIVVPGGGFTYDSDKGDMPAEPAVQQTVAALKPLVGATAVAKVDARGTVLERKLPAAMRQLLQQDPTVRAVASQLFPSGSQSNQGLPVLPILPDRPVKIGDSWNLGARELVLPLITLRFDARYTYLGRERTERGMCHKLGIRTLLKSKPAAGAPVKMEVIKSSGKGEAYIDEGLTYLVKSRARQVIEFLVKGEKEEFQYKVTSEVSFELVPQRASEK